MWGTACQYNRHFSMGGRDKKPGIYNVLHIFENINSRWFSMGHNIRKWVSSSTSELHNWQILWLRGGFGLLYQPVSSSKGRHPHLIWVTVLLLFMEMVFRMYSSGLGQSVKSESTSTFWVCRLFVKVIQPALKLLPPLTPTAHGLGPEIRLPPLLHWIVSGFCWSSCWNPVQREICSKERFYRLNGEVPY